MEHLRLHSNGAHITSLKNQPVISRHITPVGLHEPRQKLKGKRLMKNSFVSPRRTFIRQLAGLLIVSAAASPMPLHAAGETAASPGTFDTDNIISGISAFDRTRPFPVADQHAYFTNIKEGDQVQSPFRVAFSVTGMGISPVSAGKIAGTGHHHILIDKPLPVDIKVPIPFDNVDEVAHQHYKHFGKGETETVLNLPPGKHTLQLLFADSSHVPYYIKSKAITIEVLK